MNQLLESGQTVRAEHGGCDCRVQKFLGGGGQGEVYQVDLAGTPMALKWYFRHAATIEQRERLDLLVERGAPNDRFLWPLDLASSETAPYYGYLMPLRPPNYKGIVDLMRRRCDPTFRALAQAGRQLADSFLRLHSRGLCYCDISFGNVFFEPDLGDILICDNDNVTVDGGGGVSVCGTSGFMAPEIERGEATPSSRTDLHSLAVLLFYMFILHHPLEGKKESSIRCFDPAAKKLLYGTEPVFIFDPVNDTNRPVKGHHDNAIELWPIYPRFFQDLFVQAFTAGIADPHNGRVRESEWRKGLTRLVDTIIYCGFCKAENFFDEEQFKTKAQAGVCWGCKYDLVLPMRIQLGKSSVMLNHDAKLFPHHIDPDRMYDFTAPVAEISRNPTDPGKWGLKNLSGQSWTAIRHDGSLQTVAPGRSVTLSLSLRIQFGKVEGTIRI